LRTCSASSGSSRSSTSGSSSSRQCNVLNAGKSFEATQTRTSSISEVEDFQGFPPQRHSKNTRSDADPGGCKKAKIVREVTVRDEWPFIHSAGKPSRSFASLEQSLTDTDANDDHFWSKVSSPQYENSFVRHEEDDVESLLRRTDDSRSSSLRSSAWKMYDEPAQCPLSRQSASNRDKTFTGERPSENYFHQRGNVQCVNSFGSVCTELGSSVSKERMPASNLQQPSIHQREPVTNLQTVTSDLGRKSTKAGDIAASTARSNKWWAFVNGITSAISSPGQLLLSVLIGGVFVNQSINHGWLHSVVVSTLALINVVHRHWSRLVVGWVRTGKHVTSHLGQLCLPSLRDR